MTQIMLKYLILVTYRTQIEFTLARGLVRFHSLYQIIIRGLDNRILYLLMFETPFL